MADVKAKAEALVPKFKLDRVLNQDQAGRRTSLLGTIDAQPALLILERAPFPTDPSYLGATPTTLSSIANLGANDVYHWYLANTGGSSSSTSSPDPSLADLKINLIYPCTETHVKKYSKQGVRLVTETPHIYASAGRTEVEDVIYRTELGASQNDEGFLLLPDLNWDRKTIDALHLLALVERRDIWSLRDLRRKHIPWLRHMKAKLLSAAVMKYPEVEPDQLKLYVHYQPTYYHFHIHIVHVQLEAGATQAVGKAVGLDSITETLEAMGGDEEAGMEQISLSYTLGEASELWTEVYEPLKRSGAASQ
uniref:mRNA decapping n=1 Tax=Colletotrichum fructicola (strain Nara gc5) TaxID=1213859 RepID=L2FI10_COLFN